MPLPPPVFSQPTPGVPEPRTPLDDALARTEQRPSGRRWWRRRTPQALPDNVIPLRPRAKARRAG